MNQKIKQILLLYLREPGLMILAALGFCSLCATQGLVYWGLQKNLWNEKVLSLTVGQHKHVDIFVHKYILGDELISTVFIIGLWLMFAFGLMIKRQMANDRASLLPGYRAPHAAVFAGILAATILVTVALSKSAMSLSQIYFLNSMNVTVSLTAIYLVILAMAFFMMYLGYLSMGYAVVAGYILLAVMGQNIVSLLQFFSGNTIAYNIGLIALVVAANLFVKRLLSLKNENIEYPFLLTWPPQKTMRNQAAIEQWAYEFKTKALKFFGIQFKEPVFPSYSGLKSIWARANHWGSPERSNISSLMVISALGLIPYYFILKSPLTILFISPKVEANFLLLAGAPVLLTIIANYKGMIFWNYDLLKPVSRKNFFREQGAKFLQDLIMFWMIIMVYFGIMPATLSAEKIDIAHFIIFTSMTFAFSLLCLGWLAALSAIRDERAVVWNGLALCLLIMSEFFGAGQAPSVWLFANAAICMVLTGLFLKLAFEKWMNIEF